MMTSKTHLANLDGILLRAVIVVFIINYLPWENRIQISPAVSVLSKPLFRTQDRTSAASVNTTLLFATY